jgi:NRPS condensation-like uncharacterized protein
MSGAAAIPDTLPVEFQDQTVRIFSEKGTSGNLTMCLDFPDRLDAEVLRRATRAMMDAEPILGCRMDLSAAEPVWRRRADLEAVSDFTVAEVADVEAETRHRVGLPFDPDTAPNFSVVLLKGPQSDRLLLQISHIVADGGATFEVAVRFAQVYSGLVDDPSYTLVPNLADRDSFAWLKPFGWRDRLRIVRRDIGDILRMRKPQGGFKLADPEDLAKPGEGANHVLVEVPKTRLAEIDALAASRGVTRNDLLLAGFARAYAQLTGTGPDQSIQLAVPNNLRRYAEVDGRPPVCNLGGVANIFVEPGIGANFSQTVDRLAREMERQRTGFMGAGNPLTMRMFAKMPFARKRATIAKMLAKAKGKTAPPAFTNVGRLAERRLRFAGTAPERVRLYCYPIRKPVIVVAVMEYRGVLMLSACHYTSDSPAEDMERLLRDTVGNIASD